MYENDPRSDTRDSDVFRWLLLAAVVALIGGIGLYVTSAGNPVRTAETPAVTEPAQPQMPRQTPPAQ